MTEGPITGATTEKLTWKKQATYPARPLVPPGCVHGERIVALIRALLEEDHIPFRSPRMDYERFVDELRETPYVQGLSDVARRLQDRPLGFRRETTLFPNLHRIEAKWTNIDRTDMPELADSMKQAVAAPDEIPEGAKTFVNRYFYSHDRGQKAPVEARYGPTIIFLGIATLEAANVDPLDIDILRASLFPEPSTLYRRMNRKQRREGPKLHQRLRKEGWVHLDDAALLHHAELWVGAWVANKTLTQFVLKTHPTNRDPQDKLEAYDPTPDRHTYEQWDKWLAPFDVALGIPRPHSKANT